MIDGGYLLTNAHVVHGFDQVRVVFPDGSEFLEVPVKNSDDLIDLAVLGPIDTDLSALNLRGREDLAIGSEVLLVGYPAESEEFPQPTITRGILSRIRQWEAIGMTYFQTDAALTGGQSGGALVSELGEIIGLSGLRFSDVGFGLVASAADLSPLVDNLVKGQDISVLGPRPLPSKGGAQEHLLTLSNAWDSRRFIIDAPVGSTVELELDGVADAFLAAIDPFGVNVFFADSGFTGKESGSVTIETQGQYIAVVGFSTIGLDENFTLKGNAGLVPDGDPDDGVVLSVGDTVTGNIDTLGDGDYFLLKLDEGQTVEIRVESLNIDTFLIIDFPGSRIDQIVSDDDSGVGILGTDAAITYRAIQSSSDDPAGTHYLVVGDAIGINTGGYFISVTEAPLTANPVIIPPSYETVESPLGLMIVWESGEQRYTVQVPSDWTEGLVDPAFAAFFATGPTGSTVTIVVEDTRILGSAKLDLSGYLDLLDDVVFTAVPGTEVVSRERVLTGQGETAELIELSLLSGLITGFRYVYVGEDGWAFNITYAAESDNQQQISDLITYSTNSFVVN